MNLILFGRFLSAGHYRGMSVGWVILCFGSARQPKDNRSLSVVEMTGMAFPDARGASLWRNLKSPCEKSDK